MVESFEAYKRRREMESYLLRRELLSPPSTIREIRRDYWPIDWQPRGPNDP